MIISWNTAWVFSSSVVGARSIVHYLMRQSGVLPDDSMYRAPDQSQRDQILFLFKMCQRLNTKVQLVQPGMLHTSPGQRKQRWRSDTSVRPCTTSQKARRMRHVRGVRPRSALHCSVGAATAQPVWAAPHGGATSYSDGRCIFILPPGLTFEWLLGVIPDVSQSNAHENWKQSIYWTAWFMYCFVSTD